MRLNNFAKHIEILESRADAFSAGIYDIEIENGMTVIKTISRGLFDMDLATVEYILDYLKIKYRYIY